MQNCGGMNSVEEQANNIQEGVGVLAPPQGLFVSQTPTEQTDANQQEWPATSTTKPQANIDTSGIRPTRQPNRSKHRHISGIRPNS